MDGLSAEMPVPHSGKTPASPELDMRVKQIAIFVVVAAIGGMLAYLYPTDAQERHPVKLISTGSAPSFPETLPATQPVSAPAKPAEDGMAQMFAKTRNMRAFVEYAKQHPEKGGYAYAMKGLQKCRVAKQFTDVFSSFPYDQTYTAEKYAERQKAFADLQYMCQGFSESELSDDGVRSVKEEGVQKNDPFIKLMVRTEGISSTSDPEGALRTKNQILQTIFAYKDPLLLNDFGMRGNTIQIDSKLYFFLEGKSHPFFSDECLILRASWRLAACELRGDCSGANEDVLMACITAAHCSRSLTDLIRDELMLAGDKDGQWFQRAVMYARQIVDAIRRGDLQAFRPPA